MSRLSRGDLETAYRVARRDRHDLLGVLKGHGVCEENMDAEIARLTAENVGLQADMESGAAWDACVLTERARIAAVLVTLITLRCSCHICNGLATLDRAAVVAIVEGDA